MMDTLAEHVRAAKRRLRFTRQSQRQSPQRIARDAQRYWNASRENGSRRDLSHWVGEGRWVDVERWREIGRTHFAMFRALCNLAGVAVPGGRALEWGPGGGANAVEFVKTFNTFIGVDISRPNLAECGRQLATMGFAGYQPVHIEAADPESALPHVDEPVDFVLSTAVYQHMPSKAYGARVTQCLARLLKPGGLGLIQTRYSTAEPGTASKHANYERNALRFTAYRVEEFWAIARECELEPLAVKLVETDRYAYYFLRKASTDDMEATCQP